MFDGALRPVKDRTLVPLAQTPIGRIPPLVLTAFGLACSIGAALAAWQQLTVLAVGLWLFGRLADGLDGVVARETGEASDVGGLLDFTFDTIGYAAVPIGLAFAVDTNAIWIVTSLLLASFYLNSVSLGYVAALLEKHGRAGTRTTSAVLPRGLVEGTETILFFTVALAVPSAAVAVWGVMAAAVTITALERVRWAIGRLR